MENQISKTLILKNTKKAIVKQPAQSISNITIKNPYLNKPDYDLALREHKRYVQALEKAGVEVINLEPENAYPSSVIVDDIAVIVPNVGIIMMNQKDDTRIGEEVSIRTELEKHFPNQQFFKLSPKAYVRGSDVLIIGNNCFIGLSAYTSRKGIKEITNILKRYNKRVIKVDLFDIVTLKAGIGYLDNNILLIAEQLSNKREFSGFKRIVIPKEEAAAINSILVNDYVIMPIGCPRTSEAIKRIGFKVIELNFSEYKKIEVGPSELSIRF